MTLQVFVTQPSICMRLSLCSHQYGIRRVGHFSHNFLLPRNGNLVPKSAFCHFSRATKKSGYLQKSQDRWVHNKNASDRLTTKHWISNHLSYDHIVFFVIDWRVPRWLSKKHTCCAKCNLYNADKETGNSLQELGKILQNIQKKLIVVGLWNQ